MARSTHCCGRAWAAAGALPGARLQQPGRPRWADELGRALAVWAGGRHHALQLPARDPGAAAHGRALHGQQAAAARRPEGVRCAALRCAALHVDPLWMRSVVPHGVGAKGGGEAGRAVGRHRCLASPVRKMVVVVVSAGVGGGRAAAAAAAPLRHAPDGRGPADRAGHHHGPGVGAGRAAQHALHGQPAGGRAAGGAAQGQGEAP